MKYKIGDRVRIKSRDWYNEHKDMNGNVYYGCNDIFNPCTARHCGQVLTIKRINSLGWYEVEEEAVFVKDEMIEGPVFEYEGIAYTLPDGYIFKDENGNELNITKIILEKKKKEYPKTYEECCDILQLEHTFEINDLTIEEETLLKPFIQLKRCRDAYWKIAGEEMGLGKPWEPDCNKGYFIPAIIYRSSSIQKVEVQYRNAILSFPTHEMRDAFFENFKSEIESCKELL